MQSSSAMETEDIFCEASVPVCPFDGTDVPLSHSTSKEPKSTAKYRQLTSWNLGLQRRLSG